MEFIRQYILSVLAAAIICAIANVWLDNKGAQGGIIRLLTGVFMTITLISPLVQLDLSGLDEYFETLTTDGEDAVTYGLQIAEESEAEIIKSRTEAYILDKAAFWELNLEVEVTLSESDPPVPESVLLRGNASPYARSQLTKCIADELGIPEDRQQWT